MMLTLNLQGTTLDDNAFVLFTGKPNITPPSLLRDSKQEVLTSMRTKHTNLHLNSG